MNYALPICLIIVGLINFIPVLGVLSADRLAQAYDVELASNDLIILMRHRALLFGLIGAYILASSFITQLQNSAIILALVSMLGFIIIALLEGGYNTSLSRIMLVDFVGLFFLLVAIGLKYF